MSSNASIPEDRTFSPPVAVGLATAVGFYFSFRVILVLLAARILKIDPRTGAGLNVGVNLLLLALVCFYSFGEAREKVGSMLRLQSVKWVLAFLIFSGCSFGWSSTASMPAAVAYWLAMVADVVMVVLLLRVLAVEDVVSSIIQGFVWGACVVAAVAWLLPTQSDMRLGDEELLGPNQIGYACAFAFFLAQHLFRNKGKKWGIAALFLAVTVLRSLSKTTMAAFLVAESLILLRDKTIGRKRKVWIGIVALVAVAAFWNLLFSYFDKFASGTDPETLTGRVDIWAVVLDAAVMQPWIGHGFHSVWKVIPPIGSGFFEARHAHNELIQQFYSYGVVGIGLLVGLYGSLYLQVRKLKSSPWKTFVLGMLLFVLVRGIADTEAFDLSLPLWFIILLSMQTEDVRIEGAAGEQPENVPQTDSGFSDAAGHSTA